MIIYNSSKPFFYSYAKITVQTMRVITRMTTPIGSEAFEKKNRKSKKERNNTANKKS